MSGWVGESRRTPYCTEVRTHSQGTLLRVHKALPNKPTAQRTNYVPKRRIRPISSRLKSRLVYLIQFSQFSQLVNDEVLMQGLVTARGGFTSRTYIHAVSQVKTSSSSFSSTSIHPFIHPSIHTENNETVSSRDSKLEANQLGIYGVGKMSRFGKYLITLITN